MPAFSSDGKNKWVEGLRSAQVRGAGRMRAGRLSEASTSGQSCSQKGWRYCAGSERPVAGSNQAHSGQIMRNLSLRPGRAQRCRGRARPHGKAPSTPPCSQPRGREQDTDFKIKFKMREGTHHRGSAPGRTSGSCSPGQLLPRKSTSCFCLFPTSVSGRSEKPPHEDIAWLFY